ncbi:MAG: hypothetical protein M1822_004456 [Bathelium mastoideum]|nr:MAG: hypothetical protein M1822_004456 [Bathelium mastoideum]
MEEKQQIGARYPSKLLGSTDLPPPPYTLEGDDRKLFPEPKSDPYDFLTSFDKVLLIDDSSFASEKYPDRLSEMAIRLATNSSTYSPLPSFADKHKDWKSFRNPDPQCRLVFLSTQKGTHFFGKEVGRMNAVEDCIVKLRRDVNFDRDLHFRPNLDGSTGQQKLSKAKEDWTAVKTELDEHAADCPFAFSPGQMSKLYNPKSLRVFHALGGLLGLEKGLEFSNLSAETPISSSRTSISALHGLVTDVDVAFDTGYSSLAHSIFGGSLLSNWLSPHGSWPSFEFSQAKHLYHNPAAPLSAFIGLRQARWRRGPRTFSSRSSYWTGLLCFAGSATALPLPTGSSSEPPDNQSGAAIGIGVAVGIAILSVAAAAALIICYRKKLSALGRKVNSQILGISRRSLELIRKNDKVIAGSGMILSFVMWNMPLFAEGKNSVWLMLIGISWFAATAMFMVRQSQTLAHREGYVVATVAVAALLSVINSATQRGNGDSIITLLTFWSSIAAFLLAYVWPRR